MAKPLVSILILNRNGKEVLPNLLASIKKLQYPSIEVILADNGSMDTSLDIAKEAGIHAVSLPTNKGTDAYNHAYKLSKGKYILIIGNDMELKEDSVSVLVDFMEQNKEVGLAVPKFLSYYDKKSIDCAGNWLSTSFYSGVFKEEVYLHNSKIVYGIGLLRKEAIETFGYIMDPDYLFYAEDVDLGLRFWISGWEVRYVPKSIMYHMGSQSLKVYPSPVLTYQSERNLLRTFFTTLSFSNILRYFLFVYFMRLLAILKDLSKFNLKGGLSRIKAIFWPLLHLKTLLRKRAHVQSRRKLPDSIFLKLCTNKYLIKR